MNFSEHLELIDCLKKERMDGSTLNSDTIKELAKFHSIPFGSVRRLEAKLKGTFV